MQTYFISGNNESNDTELVTVKTENAATQDPLQDQVLVEIVQVTLKEEQNIDEEDQTTIKQEQVFVEVQAQDKEDIAETEQVIPKIAQNIGDEQVPLEDEQPVAVEEDPFERDQDISDLEQVISKIAQNIEKEQVALEKEQQATVKQEKDIVDDSQYIMEEQVTLKIEQDVVEVPVLEKKQLIIGQEQATSEQEHGIQKMDQVFSVLKQDIEEGHSTLDNEHLQVSTTVTSIKDEPEKEIDEECIVIESDDDDQTSDCNEQTILIEDDDEMVDHVTGGSILIDEKGMSLNYITYII